MTGELKGGNKRWVKHGGRRTEPLAVSSQEKKKLKHRHVLVYDEENE